MEVGDTYTITNDDGEEVQAKVTYVDRYRMEYKTRKGGKGRYSMATHEKSRRAFNKHIVA